MDKNAREKQNLYEWACKYADTESGKYFTEINKEQATYFEERTGAGSLQEYGFETADELRSLLHGQWGCDPVFDEIMPSVLVAALKNRTVIAKSNVQKTDAATELPTFIYNF